MICRLCRGSGVIDRGLAIEACPYCLRHGECFPFQLLEKRPLAGTDGTTEGYADLDYLGHADVDYLWNDLGGER